MSDKKEHKITYYDIQVIVSSAKTDWVNKTMPFKVSKKTVDGNDPAHVVMIESVINYLNGKGLLNTFVKIDYDEKK